MSDITVRRLAENEWEQYRAVRLTALEESPEAFAATLEEEQQLSEQDWRDRMGRSTRLLAERDGASVGVASVGVAGESDEDAGELFGLWVEPALRGSGIATELVRAGAETAASQGYRRLRYWVGTENGRAVAFASGYGFRPTSDRRPMGVVSEEDGEEEIAMELPLER